jgi:hypothetical protein
LTQTAPAACPQPLLCVEQGGQVQVLAAGAALPQPGPVACGGMVAAMAATGCPLIGVVYVPYVFQVLLDWKYQID